MTSIGLLQLAPPSVEMKDKMRNLGPVKPTIGTITVGGRVSALLELGAGFNLEFSGRDNVYLNGSVLGLTTRQVADHLVISAKTADHHVQHIYTKIGVSTRAAAALFAMEHGLLA